MVQASHIAGNRTNRSGLDQYYTPPSVTHSLMKRIRFVGLVWECAAGSGRMSDVIKEYNPCVATDIITGTDFLTQISVVPNIVTNPPYKLAEQFVRKAYQLTTEKVAMFLRLNFLEGQARYRMFKDLPLEWVLVFSKRQNLYPEGYELPQNGGTIAYAWFVWNHTYKGIPQIDWIKE